MVSGIWAVPKFRKSWPQDDSSDGSVKQMPEGCPRDFYEGKKTMVDNYAIIENYLMIRMPEEIDHHKAVTISKNADAYIAHSKIVNIVFDFEDTKFMDSSGIGVIMGRYKKISCFGGQVFAINASSRIRRLLTASGMQKLITIME